MKEMDLSLYFEPCPFMEAANFYPDDSLRLGRITDKYTVKEHFPEIEGARLVILGVSESRGGDLDAAKPELCCNGADAVRKCLYNLYPPSETGRLVDLGNLRSGQTPEDTYYALADVLVHIMEMRIPVLLLGGTQDLTYAVYKAYARMRRMCNILSVDSRLNFAEDLGGDEQEPGGFPVNNRSFMSRIAVEPDNYLFDYLNLGYQTYLVDKESLSLMDRLNFDICRLGAVRENIAEAEPYVRDADCLSFDLSSVKRTESPANPYAMPTGFTAEDACQIFRYAGLTHGLDVACLFEYYPAFDRDSLSANLLAEMAWCFIDGMRNRLNDHPAAAHRDVSFKEYIVPLENMDRELIFCKCRQTDRWWMKLPCEEDQREQYGRHSYVACSYSDYQIAMQNDIPPRWWKAAQRIK